MENLFLQEHQRKITANYFRRINNLRKLGRFQEAAMDLNRLAGIYQLWAIQNANIQSAAKRGINSHK